MYVYVVGWMEQCGYSLMDYFHCSATVWTGSGGILELAQLVEPSSYSTAQEKGTAMEVSLSMSVVVFYLHVNRVM